MVNFMSRKINVKTMDMQSLSDYNVASVELLRLNAEKAAEVAPLREERKTILAKRAEALSKEGAVLDDVLREFSLDAIDMKINAVNNKYAEPLKECAKAQNKVLRLIPADLVYAYKVSMDSKDSLFKATGTCTYEKKSGETVTVIINNKNTFFAGVKTVYEQLGALGTDDNKAMDKLVQYHTKRIGGLVFNRRTQENMYKKQSELANGLVRDIINYLVQRGVVTVAEDGSLNKLSPVGVVKTEEVA